MDAGKRGGGLAGGLEVRCSFTGGCRDELESPVVEKLLLGALG